MKRIESVSITNIHGIERAEFPLGTLTVLEGANGTGKTSILRAIAAVFEGGHDPDWLHAGAEEGEIGLTLSDGVTITAKVRKDGTRREVRTSDGSLVNKPATYIERLASGFSYDPIGFLQAPAKEQVKFLLAALPIRFAFGEIADASGRTPAGDMDLQQFNAFRDGLYEDRRKANLEAKNLDGAINTLGEGLPKLDGVDCQALVAQLEVRLDAFKTELSEATAEIESKANTERLRILAERDVAIEKLRADAEATLERLETAKDDAVKKSTADIQQDIESTAMELATAKSNAEQQTRAEATRTNIETFRAQWKAKDAEAEKLTYALEKLDALKLKKLAESPVPGMEIVDGQIMVDGIPLQSLNTQKQYFVAFQVAALAPGAVGFMICDRSESIVGEQWEQFQQAAAASGFQVACARSIPDAPLSAVVDGTLFPVGAPPAEKTKQRRTRQPQPA